MDDTQTAFATQYPPYGFDLDMMKVRIFPHKIFLHINVTRLCPTCSAPWILSVVRMPKRPAGRPTRLVHPPLMVLLLLPPVMLLQITAMARRQAFPKASRIVLPLQPLQGPFILPPSIRQLRRCPDRSAPALQMRLLSSSSNSSNNSRPSSSSSNNTNTNNSNSSS